MGQSHSSSSSTTGATPKRRLLITPKKLIRLRKPATTSAEGAKRNDASAHNQRKKSGGVFEDYQSADTGESNLSKQHTQLVISHVLSSLFTYNFHLLVFDVEQLIKTKTFNNNEDYDDLQLPPTSTSQPVLNSRQSETHTNEHFMEAAATGKYSNERAFSHDLSAKDESLIEESLLQLRELIENLLCSDHSDAPIVIEIDSEEKSLKILPQSSLTKEEELNRGE